MRTDIHGEPRCPKTIADFLVRVGGKTPTGEAMYRCVHSSTVYRKQGGMWKEWDDSLTLQERGGMVQSPSGFLVPSHCKPNSVEVCIKEIRKYEQEGMENAWILERWVPASYFGSEKQWYAQHVPGYPSVPLLGPYPSDGDYRLVAGPIPTIPELSRLKEAIERTEQAKEELRGDVEAIVKEEMYEAQRAYDAQEEKNIAEREARYKDILSPWTSTSLGAGRIRQAWADAAGVRGHAGN